MPPVPRPRTAKQAPKQDAKTATTETTGSSPKPPPPPTPTLTRADAKLRDSVKGMYEGIGMLALGLGIPREDARLVQFGNSLVSSPATVDLVTGQLVAGDDPNVRTGADRIADAWMTYADRSPRVKDLLRKVTEGGAAAELVMLHATLIYPFLPGLPGLAQFLPGVRTSRNGHGATA